MNKHALLTMNQNLSVIFCFVTKLYNVVVIPCGYMNEDINAQFHNISRHRVCSILSSTANNNNESILWIIR